MNFVLQLFVRARETLINKRNAQTMTEYVLVLSAIAVVVYGVYLVLGNNVSTLASGADSVLTNA
jgi:Flp pilus assembly pilin Flp